MDRVGVIGLGKMGLPIARNLMVRGFHVTGYRRSGSPEFLKEGGTVAASAAEVAADADVILSIVPTADDVEEIITGPAGTLTNLKPGTIHIEMSTIDVDRKARLRDQVRAKGGDLLDCPIKASAGHRYYTKEAHVADLTDEAVDSLVAFWQDMPMEGEVEIIGLGGAIGDVAEADTAFSDRGYLLWLNLAMRWDDPADDEDYIARTRRAVAGLAPWTGRGVYVNMLNFDEQDRVVEALDGPEKYAGLARLKARYDPANLFRMNANIAPA